MLSEVLDVFTELITIGAWQVNSRGVQGDITWWNREIRRVEDLVDDGPPPDIETQINRCLNLDWEIAEY